MARTLEMLLVAAGLALAGCGDNLAPPVTLPGPALSLSAGGTVERQGDRYRLTLTVAPMAPAAVRSSASHRVELGIEAQRHPGRR